MFFTRRYGMNHCRHILQTVYRQYRKEKEQLSPTEEEKLKKGLLDLQSALDSGDRNEADRLAREVEGYSKAHFKKSWFKWGVELIMALSVALVVAVVIRSMWFEPYEIPTGSMRPTFKEQDHLTVSKAQFGINIPLETAHFYFDPALVQRTSAIIFSGDNLPLRDTDTTFLGIFPYKKRYVKRLMGKPEDTFTFYGGKIYSLDEKGNLVQELIDSPWMKRLENLPIITFEGQPQSFGRQEIIFNYFNQPLAKVYATPQGEIQGEIFNGKEWVADDLSMAKVPHVEIRTLGDLFGMGNFAMAQLLTKEDLQKEEGLSNVDQLAVSDLYLLLRHTPHLDYSKGPKTNPQSFPKLLKTVIPLKNEDLKKIMQAMYTARFVVSHGRVKRYSLEPLAFSSQAPRLANVPDGTYEFYYGKGYQIGFGGIATLLPDDHPLYQITPENVQALFNLGINWDNMYQPAKKGGRFPYRYAYYRDGDLYLLGMPLFEKGSKQLETFIQEELKHEETASSQNPYIAFVDRGAPDAAKIKAFGLKIPKKQYLALGDNHAMSGDSRIFGFVPEENLQGVPEYIIWPPGDRLGSPLQKPYPTFVTPRLLVWAIAALIGLVSYAIYWYRLRRRIIL